MQVLRNAEIDLETTTEAVLAADETYGRDALESVGWERRGLFQRLVQIDAAQEDEAPDIPVAA